MEKPALETRQFDLTSDTSNPLIRLCGELDANLALLEDLLSVTLQRRGDAFALTGPPAEVALAESVLRRCFEDAHTQAITPDHLFQILQQLKSERDAGQPVEGHLWLKCTQIHARTANQAHYLQRIQQHDINFGIGPAGTGKTFLAVAMAAQALEQQTIQRLILVRPAVEAGERLGFLPGDLTQKVDPYLRPLYDALYACLGPERTQRFLEQGQIEVAPLAYMRGRTLNQAMIILDESQNTTEQQMKMFLTRIGFGAKAIITGDLTQIDLPAHQQSGLRHASTILKGLPGISFTEFSTQDVVRHPLVQRIVEAYERNP